MQTKTFRAETMLTAFKDIQKALGPEAIVVSVRKVPGGPAWQIWKKPIVEVVAMGTPPAALKDPGVNTLPVRKNSATASPTGQKKAAPRKDAGIKASTDIKTQPQIPVDFDFAKLTAQEKKQLPEPQAASQVRSEKSQPIEVNDFPPLAKIRMQLISQGIDEKMVQRVTRTCSESLNPLHLQDIDRVKSHIQRQLEAGLRVQSPASILSNKIICLIGTSGAGKTSTCAKLAAFFNKSLNKKISWICADTVRAGAINEARTYTETLKIPMQLAYTPEDLVSAVDAYADSDLILVDLPGCNPRNENKILELGSFLTAVDPRSTYMVAPATAKEADLTDLMAAAKPFNINGLIFTKMDETRVFGPLYNIAWRSQLPLIFFSNGTRIMDDLYPGQDKDLVNAIFQEGFLK